MQTFLRSTRLVSRSFHSKPLLQSTSVVNILGVPIKDGQPRTGVERGPDVLRDGQTLAKRIREVGWAVNDLGDIDVKHYEEIPGVKDHFVGKVNTSRSKLIGEACYETSKAAFESAQQGNFHLTLGGDHSIAIGSIAGVIQARPNTGVIWVDAHADINTMHTSNTGNIHGMSVAFLIGLAKTREIPGFEWMKDIPKLLYDRLVYIALRDVDEGEKNFIKELGIRAYTMHDIDRYGIGKVMEMAMDHVSNRVDRPLHLSFDIDSIDPMYAPATGTQVRGGLTYREAFYVAETVASTGQLTSLDMVEVNPSLSASEKDLKETVSLAVNITRAALGDRIL